LHGRPPVENLNQSLSMIIEKKWANEH